jgi:hypothetical protein
MYGGWIVAGVPAKPSDPVTADAALLPKGVIDVEFSVPVTADAALLPKGVIVVELSVPVTAEVPLCPSGVMLVELSVPVTAEVFIVPVTAEAALCPKGVIDVEFKVPVTAEVFIVPVTAEVPSVGALAGHEIAPSVNAPRVAVGTFVGHEIVCAVTVKLGAVALQAVADPDPAAIFVAAQLPDVALAAFVGTFVGATGHAIVGCVNDPAPIVGTLRGHEIVCAAAVRELTV